MPPSDAVTAWLAVGSAAAAALAFLLVLGFYLKLRRVRQAQLVLLGGTKGDLVNFAVSLQTRIDDLHRVVDEVAVGLSRHRPAGRRLPLAHVLVRYDAYEDAGGHQSASLAFLDGARSGVVMSAIQGRDYARIYVKQLDRGRRRSRCRRRSRRRSTARWRNDRIRKADIRPFEPERRAAPLRARRASTAAPTGARSTVLERETVFVAEVDGEPAGYVAVQRADVAVAGRPALRQPGARGRGRRSASCSSTRRATRSREGALTLQVVVADADRAGHGLLPRAAGSCRPGRICSSSSFPRPLERASPLERTIP